jgi:hypothetical protein
LINRDKYGRITQEHYQDLVIGEKDGSELERINYMGLNIELTKLEPNVVIG